MRRRARRLNMNLSLILPVLNEAAILPVTFARLQGLRTGGHEILVVDGGSEDGSLQAAAGLADRLLTAPHGRARQMNAGAAEPHGHLLHRTVAMAVASRVAPVELWCTPGLEHPSFVEMGLPRRQQQGPDLGARMAAALTAGLQAAAPRCAGAARLSRRDSGGGACCCRT